ncbi:MAG: hypothetical protein C4521_11625 [Actinobacteria bacterium]|nr:MAG: hypothetical protein C4521_11625 [Actinomycetota bacterium]
MLSSIAWAVGILASMVAVLLLFMVHEVAPGLLGGFALLLAGLLLAPTGGFFGGLGLVLILFGVINLINGVNSFKASTREGAKATRPPPN